MEYKHLLTTENSFDILKDMIQINIYYIAFKTKSTFKSYYNNQLFRSFKKSNHTLEMPQEFFNN